MAVRAMRKARPFIWIPPAVTANWKLTVEREDSTIDDISDFISTLEITDGVTENFGTFEFDIWDPNETYKEAWVGNEIVRYYSDYSKTATTLRFRGRIEKPSKRGNKLLVTGQSEAQKLVNRFVTKQVSNVETSVVLGELIDSYGQGIFTKNNINVSTSTITTNFYQTPFFEAVRKLANKAGFDFYVDANLDFHYFKIGSRNNKTDAIVHERNLWEVMDFTPDITLVKNVIKIFGAKQEGIQVLYTAEKKTGKYGTNNTAFGVREELINDDNVTDFTQAQQLGDAILADRQDPPQSTEITGILLATPQPGENMRLSSPADGIDPKFYPIKSYTHNISESGLFTTIRANKEIRRLSHTISNIVIEKGQLQETSINPNEMTFSYDFLYETEEGTQSNTEITKSVLKLESGETSGNWLSPIRTLPSNLAEVYLVLTASLPSGVTVEVTGDGINFQTVSNKTKVVITTATGINFQIRVTFDNTGAEVDSLSMQYKLT